MPSSKKQQLSESDRKTLAVVQEAILGGREFDAQAVALEVLRAPAAHAARHLFGMLRRFPREVVIDRIHSTLGVLRERDDAWRRIVDRSIIGAGRCPKTLRSHLRATIRAMERQSPLPPAAALAAIRKPTVYETRPAQFQPAEPFRPEASIVISTNKTSIDQFPAPLLQDFARIPQSRKRIQVDLADVEHLYIFGIGLLATWLRTAAKQGRVANATETTRRYLDRIGFIDVVEGRTADLWAEDEGFAIALQRLQSTSSVFALTDRLVAIIDKHGFLGSDDKGGLQTTFAEMMENVLRHAGSFRNAYVGAQYYPKRRKLSIIVIDDGIGIRQSILTGWNDELKHVATTDEAAVSLAVKPLITSKPVRKDRELGHSGYGLYVVSELAVRNAGTFALTSGDATIFKYAARGNPKSRIMLHAPWHGTIVSVVFDLNQLLPIREVWATLPMIEGYSSEDFFEN